jgi:hypothetical protein
MQVQIHVMRGELLAGQETISQGMLTGVHLSHGERQLTMELPLSRPALEYIDRCFADGPIELVLRVSGWLLARDENEDGPRFASAPQPDEWVFQAFGDARDTSLRFQIHPLRQAANHVRAAERALREGQDSQVFLTCRAAIEPLPGAPKGIFANLEYARERNTLDAMVLAAGNYFHLGRHAADEGPRQGEFPVDHGDAAFALNLAKLLLAHTARVLDRPSR